MDISLYILYVLIGILVHYETEPSLRKKKFRKYTKVNWVTLSLDLVFWMPMFFWYLILKLKR